MPYDWTVGFILVFENYMTSYGSLWMVIMIGTLLLQFLISCKDYDFIGLLFSPFFLKYKNNSKHKYIHKRKMLDTVLLFNINPKRNSKCFGCDDISGN
jgi:hypothetical protein